MSKPPILIPEIIRTEIAYHGYFDVAIDHLRLPHGHERPYTVLKQGAHAAAVLALTTEGKLVTAKEYRHPLRQWLLSCPGGRIDPGESPLEAGKRELLEETGYGGGHLYTSRKRLSLSCGIRSRDLFYSCNRCELSSSSCLRPV